METSQEHDVYDRYVKELASEPKATVSHQLTSMPLMVDSAKGKDEDRGRGCQGKEQNDKEA